MSHQTPSARDDRENDVTYSTVQDNTKRKETELHFSLTETEEIDSDSPEHVH